ncbi:MAG TPA: hypothetical protein VGJ74_16365 [Burkholderiales bacterium]
MNANDTVRPIYDDLLSTNLLHLAVAIRTNLYQGVPDATEQVSHSALLYVDPDDLAVSQPFGIKDFCDKVIHADEIHRDLDPTENNYITVLRGRHRRETWEMNISVQLFCEGVLNWLDGVEAGLRKA